MPASQKVRTNFWKICLIQLLLFVITLTTLWACTEGKQQSENVTQEKTLEFVSFDTNITSRTVFNVSAFETTLYPTLQEKCGSCHGTTGVSNLSFANDITESALEVINRNTLVNFNSPHFSRLATKLTSEQHNCWSNCASDSTVIIKDIIAWRTAFISTGQGLYEKYCQACHGVNGRGSPSVPAFKLPFIENNLVTAIEATMPPAAPGSCVSNCAVEIAGYILNRFTSNQVISNSVNPLASFPQGVQQITSLCEELITLNREDIIRDVFCTTESPAIKSLADLQNVLGLDLSTITTSPSPTPPINGPNEIPSFVLTGHSTSLVAKSTSAINPRAIIFTGINQRGQPGVTNTIAIGFNRGEQFVEIVTADRFTKALFFYLFTFEQACNANNQCGNADLLTKNIETDWTNFTVYSQTDLKNTIFDCLQCHQPDGPGTSSILRMQEINFPWTHFLSRFTGGGNILLQDYFAAHTLDESYANIPAALIERTDPFLLEAFVTNVNAENIGFSSPLPAPPPSTTLPTPLNTLALPIPPAPPQPSPAPVLGIGTQPNQFDSFIIEEEVRQSNLQQPGTNIPAGISQSWDVIYEASVRGEFIPVPYHDVKVTDSIKLASMSKSYQDYLNGILAPADFPDIRDVFLDDKLRDIGFKVKAGLDGAGVITQACTQCHNSKLDQTISRAKFNVDLSMISDLKGSILTGVERDIAIATAISRLLLDDTDLKKMPPEIFKTLDAPEIDLAIQYLCAQMIGTLSICQ